MRLHRCLGLVVLLFLTVRTSSQQAALPSLLGNEVVLEGARPHVFRNGNGLSDGRFALWGKSEGFVAIYDRRGRQVARVDLDRPALGTRDMWFVSQLDEVTLRLALDTFDTLDVDLEGEQPARKGARIGRVNVRFHKDRPLWHVTRNEAFLETDGAWGAKSELPLCPTSDGAVELLRVSAAGDLALTVRAFQRNSGMCVFARDLDIPELSSPSDRLVIQPFQLGPRRTEIEILSEHNGISLAIDERFAYLYSDGEVHRYPRDGRPSHTLPIGGDFKDATDWRLLANEDGVFLLETRSSRLFRCVWPN